VPTYRNVQGVRTEPPNQRTTYNVQRTTYGTYSVLSIPAYYATYSCKQTTTIIAAAQNLTTGHTQQSSEMIVGSLRHRRHQTPNARRCPAPGPKTTEEFNPNTVVFPYLQYKLEHASRTPQVVPSQHTK
jgi:hypothetical protein